MKTVGILHKFRGFNADGTIDYSQTPFYVTQYVSYGGEEFAFGSENEGKADTLLSCRALCIAIDKQSLSRAFLLCSKDIPKSPKLPDYMVALDIMTKRSQQSITAIVDQFYQKHFKPVISLWEINFLLG